MAVAVEPTVGRIVHYRPSPGDPPGVLQNSPEFLPAIVTRVFVVDVVQADQTRYAKGVVNLKVFCDGPGIVFMNEVGAGDGPGQWQWPKRVE